jgi:hypothetical protein
MALIKSLSRNVVFVGILNFNFPEAKAYHRICRVVSRDQMLSTINFIARLQTDIKRSIWEYL